MIEIEKGIEVLGIELEREKEVEKEVEKVEIPISLMIGVNTIYLLVLDSRIWIQGPIQDPHHYLKDSHKISHSHNYNHSHTHSHSHSHSHSYSNIMLYNTISILTLTISTDTVTDNLILLTHSILTLIMINMKASHTQVISVHIILKEYGGEKMQITNPIRRDRDARGLFNF